MHDYVHFKLKLAKSFNIAINKNSSKYIVDC